jgi:hypothetical protein
VLYVMYLPINPIDEGLIINETAYNLTSSLSNKIAYVMDVNEFKEGIKKFVIKKALI